RWVSFQLMGWVSFTSVVTGHQKWRWENRRGGAYIVHQLICQGDSVLEATGMAEELIRNHIAELQGRPTPYTVLEGVKADTLQKWYYEFKEELQRTFPKELFTKPD
ncbi:hypothetical protein VSS37_09615, partial [Candidatus Thiothrix sp. Deng01]